MNLSDRQVRIIFGLILAVAAAVVVYLGSPDVAIIPEQLVVALTALIAGLGGYAQVRSGT